MQVSCAPIASWISTAATALGPSDLRRPVDASALGFKTTADLEPISGLIGQDRALRAIEFGANMKAHDFNIFVLGRYRRRFQAHNLDQLVPPPPLPPIRAPRFAPDPGGLAAPQ